MITTKASSSYFGLALLLVAAGCVDIPPGGPFEITEETPTGCTIFRPDPLGEGGVFEEANVPVFLGGARGGHPAVGDIARELEMSPRSLRRRLEAEGTSYAAVVGGVRMEVARKILADGSRTIQEAAFEMGFSDVSSFYRAFRRWTGMTPVDYRKSLDG